MNYRILFQKLYVVLIVLLAVVVHLAEPIEVEATTGDASGSTDGAITSFGFNNPTFISGVQIMDASGFNPIGSGSDAVDLTRLSEFVIQFDVYDLDGFSNLDVYVALFNLDSSQKETDSGVLKAAINSGLSDTSLVVRWIAPERSVFLSGIAVADEDTFDFVITSGQDNFYVKSGINPISSGTYNSGLGDFIDPTVVSGAVTWEVGSGVLFGSGTSTVLQSGIFNVYTDSGTTVSSSGIRNIQYRVQIPIRLSKVAPSSGVWNVGVMVHDRLQQEIDTSRTNTTVLTDKFADEFYQNQWYGEVNIITQNPQIIFSGIQAGTSAFKISEASGLSGVEVLFISNGNFNQQVQADTTWNPLVEEFGRPKFAFLVPSSGLDSNSSLLLSEGNRFALQARRTQLESGDLEENGWTDILPPTRIDQSDPSNFVAPAGSTNVYRQNRDGGSSATPGIIGTINTVPNRTTEVGISSRFEFGLRISTVFSNTTYSGNISLGISNQPNSFQINDPNPS